MDPWSAVAIVAAGTAAGTINTIVGSGTLVTFPTLLALGYPPVVANVSNNVGLVGGGLTGTWGYRRELAGQRHLLTRLVPMSLIGSVTGAVLLLALPESAFATIVPALIAVALVLVVAQPRIARATAARRERTGRSGRAVGPLLAGGVLLAGVYGGYFGAAQGVLLIGLLGSLLTDSLQRINAVKNTLGTTVNTVAAVAFVVLRPSAIDWVVVALITLGSTVGGLIGARVGRWLPAPVLRGAIVVVGSIAIARLVWTA